MAAVNVAPKDIVIEVNDSCNWCCCFGGGRIITEDTPVYITSTGKARIFDPQKAADERETLKRCLSNLQKKLDEISSQSNKNAEEVKTMLREKVGKLPTEAEPAHVTVGIVERINEVIQSVFS